ncbi:DUF4383 domain-containing protein [Modestobacter sp. URMC 112]
MTAPGAAPAPTASPAPPASPPQAAPATAPSPAGPPPGARDEGRPGEGGGQVALVQRAGAVLLAAVLATFGLLGFLERLDYFSTEGGRIAGLSSNNLLSAISILTAVVLVAAAVRGARPASTVMLLLGIAFLLSALANLAALNSSFNILAFSMANVVFSLCAGVFLLVLGAYGRVSGNLPDDSPYRAGADPAATDAEFMEPEHYATTPEERAVEAAMRAAELAVAEHRATPEQARRVAAMAEVRTRADRRRVWTECERTAIG